MRSRKKCACMVVTALTVGIVMASTSAGAAPSAADRAAKILQETGVRGGLIVHLGCGDGRLTAALGAAHGRLVHGLDRDAEHVRRARRWIRSQGLYGPISVEHRRGDRLPYADNLVNLLVVEGADGITRQEMLRVLAPEGVAYLKENGRWTKIVKPRPEQIDEWTHFLHDATGNAVADDEVVGPPRRLQWDAGPAWARGHENLASVSVLLSSGGRVFYIADEGPIASVKLPSDWQLIARDAFSGVLLWKQPIGEWEYRLRPFRSGPPQLHRRMVAVGETVYVTLGYGAPLSALDAATGQIRREYAGTEGTEEIVYADGVLYLVIGDVEGQRKAEAAVRRGKNPPPVEKRVMAVRADDGDVLWRVDSDEVADVFPLTLAVADGRAVYQTTAAVVARDAATGKPQWRAPHPAELKRRAWAVPTLVIHGDVVLSADQGPLPTPHPDGAAPAQPPRWHVTHAGGGKQAHVAAYAADSGKLLWNGPAQQTYNAPPDVLIADGLLWTGKLVRADEPGITRALDPATGKVKRQRPADQKFFNAGMSHHRCYRNKATCNYLVLGRSGAEFVDLNTGRAEAHHWVRGTCQHGVVPCNGLLYAPPHSCACFIKAMLHGLNALAPADERGARAKGRGTRDEGRGTREPSGLRDASLAGPSSRLERGPAYGKIDADAAPTHPTADWPTYRHDAARSGTTPAAVSPDLKRLWRTDLGGKVSPVVVADGRLLVARIDAQTVHALDAATGERLWSFPAGGRVDSPPTAWRGRAIFGCADGWVYCLRLADGKLVWRFRAAPADRRMVSYDRLESAWPVSGSVLVLDAVVYCAAGRSIFLDGGLRLWRLDPATGKPLSQTRLSAYDRETGEQRQRYQRARRFEIPGALPDVLSSDGRRVFMRHAVFDLDGRRRKDTAAHLFSPLGFLDDTWWHRGYWVWGTDFQAGWSGWWRAAQHAPAGRILVVDDDEIFGFGRSEMPGGNTGQWNRGEHYRFFATPKDAKAPSRRAKREKGSRERWSRKADFDGRAIVLAGDTLFAAGPVGDTHRSLDAFRGNKGSVLRALATDDGRTIAEYPLDAMPRFDGLAAAAGRLYLATADGKVTAFGRRKPRPAADR